MPAFKKRVTHSLGSWSAPGEFADLPVGDLDSISRNLWTRKFQFGTDADITTGVWDIAGAGNAPTATALLQDASTIPPVGVFATVATAATDDIIVTPNGATTTAGLGIPMNTTRPFGLLVRGTVSQPIGDVATSEAYFGIGQAVSTFWTGSAFTAGFYKAATGVIRAVYNLTPTEAALSAQTTAASAVATMPATSILLERLDLAVYLYVRGTKANIAWFVNGDCVKALTDLTLTAASEVTGPCFGTQNTTTAATAIHITGISVGVKY